MLRGRQRVGMGPSKAPRTEGGRSCTQRPPSGRTGRALGHLPSRPALGGVRGPLSQGGRDVPPRPQLHFLPFPVSVAEPQE